MKRASVKPSLEKVVSADDSCLVLEEVCGREVWCVYHYHPEYELTYVVAGHGHVLIGSSIESFGPGHVALIGPNIPHYYVWTDFGGPESQIVSRVLKFRIDCLGEGFFDIRDMSPVKQLFEQSRNGVALLPEDGEELGECIATLFHASPPMRVAMFLEVLCGIVTARKHVMLRDPLTILPNDVDTDRINRALTYIHRHLDRKILVSQVSKAAGLSTVAFARVFSRVMRKTFSAYVLELRLARACRLLTETTQSVTEIAYTSGFQNLSNFNRLFRKNQRITPREFRYRARTMIDGAS